MKVRVKMLFELPEGVAPIEFAAGIRKEVKMEITGVFFLLKGVGIPDNFRFEEEKKVVRR